MIRQLALLDVTAMSNDAVCVAGLDLDSRQTLRLNHPQPTRNLLDLLGGFVPGDVISVDCDRVASPERPHVEDAGWIPATVKKLRRLEPLELAELVRDTALQSVEEAFGVPALSSRNGNHAWTAGTGERSLATVRVHYVRLRVTQTGIRGAFRDEGDGYWQGVPFQDLQARLHGQRCAACATNYFDHLRGDFDGNHLLIRIGLTRAYAPSDDQPPACWLQVTNILARQRAHFG